MSWPTNEDVSMLDDMPKSKLLKLFFLHIKNLWRVDGLYFLGIEKKTGTDVATEIDAECWKTLGKIEARELSKTLGVKNRNVASLLQILRNTSWALYQIEKEVEATPNKGVFRVTRCRTQETRRKMGLTEFPCRAVRLGYLANFALEFNPKIQVKCKVCPPSSHSENLWCEWEFILPE